MASSHPGGGSGGSSSGGSAIDQILSGRSHIVHTGRMGGGGQQQRRNRPSQQQQPQSKQKQRHHAGASGTPVSVGTGSRRARALQQLAAKRGRKVTAGFNSTNSSMLGLIGGAGTTATTTTPRAGAAAGGRRRVSLGTTPLANATATPARRRDSEISVQFPAGAAGAVGALRLRIASRVDRAGRPVSEDDDDNMMALELRPVRLVPLQGGEQSAAAAPLSVLFHNVDADGDDDGDAAIAWEDIRKGGDRCTVVEADDPPATTVPLSLPTVNVLLLGMGAGMLLRRRQDRAGAAGEEGYCFYQPTSVTGGDLYVVPDAAAPTKNGTSGSTANCTESVTASVPPSNGDMTSDAIEIEEEDMIPASADPTGKADDYTARPSSPPPTPPPTTPLQPIALSELADAYENCIGESGDPSPSDVGGDLLPRYLASEEVVAARASASLASVYDGLRSEGMLPSKDRVVFEVRDGLAAADRREEGLVRLVSAQVMIRLGLLAHGGDAYLGWYQDSFGDELVDGDASAPRRGAKKTKKKNRKKSKKSSSPSACTPAEFFQGQITELLSCVQFALPTTQTFSDFLNEAVASPFVDALGGMVRALFDYFEVDVPDAEIPDGDKRSDAEATTDTVPKNISPLQSEARGGVAFPLLEESLKREIDDEHANEEKPEAAKDPDSPLFRLGSVDLSRKNSNPLLANGKHTYIGSHFSNKLTNMSDLFREVEVPDASAQSASGKKRERPRETTAGTNDFDLTEPSSRSLLKKRSRPMGSPGDAAGDTPKLSKAHPPDSKTERSRPFAAATKLSSESSSAGTNNVRNGSVRNIVKETPMKPSRRSRIFGFDSVVPETPGRQPERHPAHLVAEVSALAAARKKKSRHR